MTLFGRALGALALLLSGCAAPVMHPRTGDVLDVGRVRLRASTVAVALAYATAEVESGNEDVLESGEYRDLWTARQFRSRWALADTVFGLVLSAEAQAAFSPFEGCELGGLLSPLRLGGEARCAVFDEDHGAPLSAAVSIGAAQQITFPVLALLASERPSDELPGGYELRAGIDLSVRASGITPLINIGVGYVRQLRELQGTLPKLVRDEWADDQAEIVVVRDELRLSVPVGAALEDRATTRDGHVARIILALVPEVTLTARNRGQPVLEDVEATTVRDFEQVWALYVTLAGEGEL